MKGNRLWWIFGIGILSVLMLQTRSLCRELLDQTTDSKSSQRVPDSTEKTVRVVVYGKRLVKGSMVHLEHLDQAQISESSCPADGIDDTNIAVGRVTIYNVKQGDTVRLRDLGIDMIPGSPARTTYLGKRDIPLPVIFAARDISEGSVINYVDLEIRKIRLSKIPPHAIVSPYSAVGRRAHAYLERGKILFEPEVGLGREK